MTVFDKCTLLTTCTVSIKDLKDAYSLAYKLLKQNEATNFILTCQYSRNCKCETENVNNVENLSTHRTFVAQNFPKFYSI